MPDIIHRFGRLPPGQERPLHFMRATLSVRWDLDFGDDRCGVTLLFAFSPRQVVDNGAHIALGHWSLVNVDHLVDLRLPCRIRQRWLIQNHVRRMTGETIVVDCIRSRTWKLPVAVRHLDIDRLQQERLFRLTRQGSEHGG
jgi:hypothetical protein